MQNVHQSGHLSSCTTNSKSAHKQWRCQLKAVVFVLAFEFVFVHLMMRMGKGVIVQCDKCRDLLAKNLASRVRIKCKGIPNEAVNLIMKINDNSGCDADDANVMFSQNSSIGTDLQD